MISLEETRAQAEQLTRDKHQLSATTDHTARQCGALASR